MKKQSSDSLLQAYIDYVLLEGKQPASVYAFMKSLEKSEADFYKHFSSFDAIETHFLKQEFEHLISNLGKDEVYAQYSAREKYLAFLYAWVENALNHRSFFVKMEDTQSKVPSSKLSLIKKEFMVYAESILESGKESKEVIARPVLGEKYAEALFFHFVYIHKFWLKDASNGFEKTDQAIEKSVHLAFDLLGQSAIDSFLDFGKFILRRS